MILQLIPFTHKSRCNAYSTVLEKKGFWILDNANQIFQIEWKWYKSWSVRQYYNYRPSSEKCRFRKENSGDNYWRNRRKALIITRTTRTRRRRIFSFNKNTVKPWSFCNEASSFNKILLLLTIASVSYNVIYKVLKPYLLRMFNAFKFEELIPRIPMIEIHQFESYRSRLPKRLKYGRGL